MRGLEPHRDAGDLRWLYDVVRSPLRNVDYSPLAFLCTGVRSPLDAGPVQTKTAPPLSPGSPPGSPGAVPRHTCDKEGSCKRLDALSAARRPQRGLRRLQ